MANAENDAVPPDTFNLWSEHELWRPRPDSHATKAWNELPTENRAHIRVVGVVDIANIILVDPIGDRFPGFPAMPTVFVSTWAEDKGPYESLIPELLCYPGASWGSARPDHRKRKKVFADAFRRAVNA